MTTDLKSKTPMQRLCDLYRDVEYLSNNNISEVRAISTAYLDVARRLEEAQRRIKELEDFFGAHDDEEALLKNELFEAQQKIVAQQARIEQLRPKCLACLGAGKWDDAEPGDISYNEFVCGGCGGSGKAKLPDDLSALTAHDTEVKAEALEEAKEKCKRLTIRGRAVTHTDCVNMLDDEAAEYRAKAGRNEHGS